MASNGAVACRLDRLQDMSTRCEVSVVMSVYNGALNLTAFDEQHFIAGGSVA